MERGGGSDAFDVVETLGMRSSMLRVLQDGPTSPSEIRDRIDVSRSTVTRALRDLETIGLVERQEGGYVTTLSGRLLVQEYESFLGTVATVSDASGALNELPPDAPFSTRFVVEGETITSDPPDVSAPGRRMSELVGSAESIWGISKAHATANAISVLRERVEAGSEVEIVFQRSVLEHVVVEYDRMASAVAEGSLEAYVTDEVPYGLFLVDDGETRTTGLLVYGEGTLSALLTASDPVVWQWAMGVFERYRERAAAVEPRTVSDLLADD